MLKRIALILVLLLTYVFADAQSSEPSYKKELWKLPVPTTPNAAALGKFGDIQVGLATGIPAIDVPIFSYTDGSKNLNVPIQLRYHAGGYKVEDMASNVGLGWALDAGGMISRAMNGTPDERPGGYLLTDSLPDIETHVPELFNYFWGDNNEPGTGQAITWGNAHELLHAERNVDGTHNKERAEGLIDPDSGLKNILPKEERDVRVKDSEIRKEQGAQPRMQPFYPIPPRKPVVVPKIKLNLNSFK